MKTIILTSLLALGACMYMGEICAKRAAQTAQQTRANRAAQKDLESDLAITIAKLESIKKSLKDTQTYIRRTNQMPLPATHVRTMSSTVKTINTHLDQAEALANTVLNESTVQF
jgi:hypothetical protein